MLIALGGLPGVGKTTIARALAHQLAAVHLRIDSIEQALRDEGVTVEGHGYSVAYAVAVDNLRLGRIVVADCVNPWPLTRAAWRAAAQRARVQALEVEIVCSDRDEHRRRIESRRPDIPGHTLPAWSEALNRDYQAWEGDRLIVDSAHRNVDDCVLAITNTVSRRHASNSARSAS
jgi:predicted kinase